jgi:hypothetical protein
VADEFFFPPQTSRRKPPPLHIPLGAIPERLLDTTFARGGARAPLNMLIGDNGRLPFFRKNKKSKYFGPLDGAAAGLCRRERRDAVMPGLFDSSFSFFFLFSLFLSRPLFWAVLFICTVNWSRTLIGGCESPESRAPRSS